MKTTFLFICAFIYSNVMAQWNQEPNKTTKGSADAYWATLPAQSYKDENGASISVGPPRYILPEKRTAENYIQHESSTIDRLIYQELQDRFYREWGITFWEKFPNDPRRFIWLTNTMLRQPNYWMNLDLGARSEYRNEFIAPLDTLAMTKWKQKYRNFRKEYLDADSLPFTESKVELARSKAALIHQEISYLIKNPWRSNDLEKFDFNVFFEKLIEYFEFLPKGAAPANQILNMINGLISNRSKYAVNDFDIDSLINRLQKSNIAALQKLAKQNELFLRFRDRSLKFNEEDLRGKKIDLKDYKGKIILLDFWHIGCGSCIAKMPVLKEVWDKYHDKGFEVISACFYLERGGGRSYGGDNLYRDQEKKIKAIHDRIGADWPLVILAGEKAKAIQETYGFIGVPQWLLLDESGKLLEYNGILFNKGQLEKIVKDRIDKLK